MAAFVPALSPGDKLYLPRPSPPRHRLCAVAETCTLRSCMFVSRCHMLTCNPRSSRCAVHCTGEIH